MQKMIWAMVLSVAIAASGAAMAQSKTPPKAKKDAGTCRQEVLAKYGKTISSTAGAEAVKRCMRGEPA